MASGGTLVAASGRRVTIRPISHSAPSANSQPHNSERPGTTLRGIGGAGLGVTGGGVTGGGRTGDTAEAAYEHVVAAVSAQLRSPSRGTRAAMRRRAAAVAV
ncbi:MAG: hypothetical protein M3O28_08245, partial [Actinomycetota bacterium]|nr:hypothetical protein [Actinomycetota bacterium]